MSVHVDLACFSLAPWHEVLAAAAYCCLCTAAEPHGLLIVFTICCACGYHTFAPVQFHMNPSLEWALAVATTCHTVLLIMGF